MSQPWFTEWSDATTGGTRQVRRNGFPYVPPHNRAQQQTVFTVTIPAHHAPRWRRRPQADQSGDVPRKLEELVDASREEVNETQQSTTIGDAAVETSGIDIPPPVMSFAEMGFFTEALSDNIRSCKYVMPTPIQRHAIPVAMAGRDLMACAQTGSGKTAAFCFPIIDGIVAHREKDKNPRSYGGFRRGVASPMALILAPTRELACQIHEEAKKFSRQTGVKVAVAYGGSPIFHQLRNLEKGVDILVATPGRLTDMIERARVSLRNVKYLALDEADRMLDMGFEPQIRKIVQQMEMPPPGARQTMLFSATFPTDIKRLASDFLSNYIFLAAGKVGSSTDLIVQRVEFVNDVDKRNYLVNILRSQKTDAVTAKDALTLVFVETKKGADALESWLSRKGFHSTAIHGNKVQMEREQALRSFRNGHTPILVATDVAARGLDIPHVAHVINFDLPRAVDDYVHRIGRTGRAGKSGLATAFFNEKNAPLAKALVEQMQGAKQAIPEWLNEYATSYKGGGGNYSRSSLYGHCRDRRTGSYGDVYNENYSLNQFTDNGAAYADYSSQYPDLDCQESSTSVPDLPYVADYIAPEADPFNSGSYNYGSVVATGWD